MMALASSTRACFAIGMRAVVAIVLAGAAVAGCGDEGRVAGEDERSSGSPPSVTFSPRGQRTASDGPATSSKRSRQGREVRVAGSDFGPMLFDGSGQAIYLFEKESTNTPECYGACARAWPPVLTTGPPQARGAVRTKLLGVIRRRDGSQQVTYDGHPLYFYAHESKNEVLCHNVSEFGGLWLVVTPSGAPAA